MTSIRLDRELVEALLSDRIEPEDENTLADQVSRLLPLHAMLPNSQAGDLSRLTAHLGGERALLEWLARRPGRPRLMAHLYRLIWLLDEHSADPAVVSALTEIRTEHEPIPPIVGEHLTPDVDDASLAGLAWAIEALAGDDRLSTATRLAIGAAELLERIALRARRADPGFGALADEVARLRTDIADAHGRL
jgi:hypothetical protein